MKRKIILLNMLLLCGLAIAFQSCQYNACKARAVECANEGVCDLGECVCRDPWEGENCEIPINKKFLSHYAMVKSELINSNPPAMDDDDTLYMYAPSALKPNIVMFYSIRDSVNMIEGQIRENAITIAEQTIDDNIFRGEGSLNGDKLTLTIKKTNNINATVSNITYVGRQYETF